MKKAEHMLSKKNNSVIWWKGKEADGQCCNYCGRRKEPCENVLKTQNSQVFVHF